MPKAARRLVIASPDPDTQADAVIDLTGKAFWQYFRWQRHCREAYLLGSFYDWKASRAGFVDGRMVTHFGVWGHDYRIGSARVRVAGIGAVATDGRHLRKGLMARTARACVADLASAGYDMTMLFGIRDFYHRFGYVRGWAEPIWTVQRKDLPAESAGVNLRRIRSEWTELADLANRTLQGLTGTAVRPTYRHPPLLSNEEQQGYLWTDSDGRPAGYVVIDPSQSDRIAVVDQAGEAATVLRVVAALARKAAVPAVTFPSLHYRSALCRLLRGGNCRLQQDYVRSGSAMVRTTSLDGVLRKIRGELARRVRSSALADWSGDLAIADPRERMVLAIDRGRVSVKPAAAGERVASSVKGGEEIAQLLIGTDEPLEVAEMASMRLTGWAARLLPVLFPAQHPCLPAWDHY